MTLTAERLRAIEARYPRDHLPSSIRDRDCIRRDEEKERLKHFYTRAKAVQSGVRTALEKQPKGKLTRSQITVLAAMLRFNLGACNRRQVSYRPGRKALAKALGLSEATIKRAFGKFISAGVIVVHRYGKGGRNGDKGCGFATEYRSGCLQFLCEQLEDLGYRLPLTLQNELVELAEWAGEKVGQGFVGEMDTRKPAALSYQEPIGSKQKPTGSKRPGNIIEDSIHPSQRPYQGRPVLPANQRPVSRLALLCPDQEVDYAFDPETGEIFDLDREGSSIEAKATPDMGAVKNRNSDRREAKRIVALEPEPVLALDRSGTIGGNGTSVDIGNRALLRARILANRMAGLADGKETTTPLWQERYRRAVAAAFADYAATDDLTDPRAWI